MAGMLFEAIPRGVELGEPVQPPRSDSGGAFDDLPDLLSDCLNPPSLHSDVSEGQLCQVAQAPSIAAEPVATWVAGQYLVRRDLQIGRTGLLVAFDTSVAPAVQLSAKSIDASAYVSTSQISPTSPRACGGGQGVRSRAGRCGWGMQFRGTAAAAPSPPDHQPYHRRAPKINTSSCAPPASEGIVFRERCVCVVGGVGG